MEFIFENKINAELVNSFYEEIITLELSKRVEENKSKTQFDCLKDLHLLRALAIKNRLYLSPRSRTFR